MKLIDADKLKDKVCEDCKFRKGILSDCRRGCTLIYDIDNAEAVETRSDDETN